MIKHTKKTSDGFTLIELLVVIAIIGLLSSVILASLSSARKKAQNAATLAEVRQVINAMTLYYDDNNQTLPGDAIGTRYCVLGPCKFQGVNVTAAITLNDLQPPSQNNTSLAAAFSKYLPTQNTVLPVITLGGIQFQGITYRCVSFDNTTNKCTTGTIVYVVNGNSSRDCGFGYQDAFDSNGTGSVCNSNPNESTSFASY